MTSTNNTREPHPSAPTNEAHSSQDSSSSSSMNTTRISFNEQVQCRATISRQDYSELEAHQTWLSREEMAKMTERQFKTVARMKSSKNSKRESAYRGLEGMSVNGEAQLDEIIKYCVDSVMDEQDRQYYLFEKIVDSEVLAQSSLNCSEECKRKALNRARSDAREAKRCYRRMRDMDSSNINHHSSASSFSISDEEHIIIPIIKTGNDVQQQTGDNREAATLQAQEVVNIFDMKLVFHTIQISQDSLQRSPSTSTHPQARESIMDANNMNPLLDR